VPAGTTTPVLQHTGDVGRLVRGLARVTRGGVEPAFRDVRRPARGREVVPP
jgi:hypothetical protein